jgi:TonB family protein
MSRKSGRAGGLAASNLFLVCLLLSAIPSDLCASAEPVNAYPTETELLPIRTALRGMREAIVYHVDGHSIRYGPDSIGTVSGYRVLGSTRVDRGPQWFDSLSAILGKTTSYSLALRRCVVFPKYVIRLRGASDSMTVVTGSDCEYLQVTPSSGAELRGWLEDDRERLATLIDNALHPPVPRKAVLRDPHLFERLARAHEVVAYRLEGEWVPACDSLVREGGSALDCFVRTAELNIRPRKAFPKLLEMLTTCTWVRSRGWISPAAPALGFRIGGDSLGVDLLVSLRTMRAMLSRPGEGCISAVLPDSLHANVAWCLWAVDPENPEALPVIQSEMRRRSLDPALAPPPDVEFVDDVRRERVDELDFHSYDEPPEVVTRIEPVYPEMAREAQIQGKVILHVLVGRDGRVKDLRVVRSVTYLDMAAVAAVRKWVYKPALKAGKVVAAWIVVPLDFAL